MRPSHAVPPQNPDETAGHHDRAHSAQSREHAPAGAPDDSGPTERPAHPRGAGTKAQAGKGNGRAYKASRKND
jgi:hypothetical protein